MTRLLAGALLALTVACTGQSEDFTTGTPPINEGPDGSDTCSATQILATTCGGCHNGSATAPKGLDLLTSGVKTRLVNVESSCNGEPLVIAGDPAGSYLLAKIDGTHACGERMPKGKPAMSGADRNCVSDWIDGLSEGSTGDGNAGDDDDGPINPPPSGW